MNNSQVFTFDKKLSITYLEDLSNEIFYEIFDFLDTCDAFEAFYDLNNHFRQFFIHLSLPYKINLDSTCRESFQHRCEYIKTTNVDRIVSLHLSSWICTNSFLLSFTLDSSFIRLESLILNGIKSDKAISLLTDLSSIPRLFSLSLTTVGTIQHPSIIHQLIFALPVLKYCNTAFKWLHRNFSLSDCIGNSSTIEYFVSKSEYYLDKFNILLSCMPRLVRLSVNVYLSAWEFYVWKPITLNNLTHFHLNHSMSFHEFETFMSNFFHQLEVLRISSSSNNDYLDSDRWKRLISTHLPRLHTFDLKHIAEETLDEDYHQSIDGFNSLFWIERQWFFDHQHYQYNNRLYIYFYSNRYKYSMNERCLSEKIVLDYDSYSFSTHDKTTINFHSSKSPFLNQHNQVKNLFVDQFYDIISYEQLNYLTVSNNNFDMNYVIELLRCSPNVQLLTLSLQNNSIQHILTRKRLTFKDVQDLIHTYPHLKALEMSIKEQDLELIIRFLFKDNTDKNNRLCLLGLRDAYPILVNRLQKVIQREKLITNYSIEYLLDTAYLWW